MRKLPAALALTAALAACATPQERCISSATADLRTLEALIGETRATLARGFALTQEIETDWAWRPCGPRLPPPAPGLPPPPPPMCMVDIPVAVTRPQAVNLDEERAKLESMLRKRDALMKESESLVASCRARFPEG